MFPKMQPCTAELWPGWACVHTLRTVPEVKNLPPTHQTLARALLDEKKTPESHSALTPGRVMVNNTYWVLTLHLDFHGHSPIDFLTCHSFSKFSQLSRNLSFICLSLIPWAHIIWDTIPIRETRDNAVAHTYSNLQPSPSLHSQKVFQHFLLSLYTLSHVQNSAVYYYLLLLSMNVACS